MEILRDLVTSIVGRVMLTAVFMLPLFAVVWLAVRRRKQFRETALEPFTDMPLRPPGESLRLKIQDLSDEFDEKITAMGFSCVGAAVFASTLNLNSTQGLRLVGIVFLLATGVCLWIGRKLAIVQRQLWDYRLGFTGERVVGEALNQLLADGFQVFHDLPFDGFNIDHVVVGPPGVYVVETKTRRKPAALSGTARATVTFDGEVLHFPTWKDSHGVKQAADNATTLSKWLSSSTGEFTPVQAILALPGWWIERKARGSVLVLNPKEIRNSFPSRVSNPLSPERIQRIAHQLTELCRLKKPE
jgi:hypothetical protein